MTKAINLSVCNTLYSLLYSKRDVKLPQIVCLRRTKKNKSEHRENIYVDDKIENHMRAYRMFPSESFYLFFLLMIIKNQTEDAEKFLSF